MQQLNIKHRYYILNLGNLDYDAKIICTHFSNDKVEKKTVPNSVPAVILC